MFNSLLWQKKKLFVFAAEQPLLIRKQLTETTTACLIFIIQFLKDATLPLCGFSSFSFIGFANKIGQKKKKHITNTLNAQTFWGENKK